MFEKPILFSTNMVNAVLDDRKHQTRRVYKNKVLPNIDLSGARPARRGNYQFLTLKTGEEYGGPINSPFGFPGTKLWVRETALFWRNSSDNSISHAAAFKASGYELETGERWTPSIHMPKKFARIWLEVQDIYIERLQDISEQDAISEGIRFIERDKYNQQDFYSVKKGLHDYYAPNAYTSFMYLWDSLNKERGYGWSVNPWVWVVKFKGVEL